MAQVAIRIRRGIGRIGRFMPLNLAYRILGHAGIRKDHG